LVRAAAIITIGNAELDRRLIDQINNPKNLPNDCGTGTLAESL
jgi:hypothetical protein